MKPLLCALSVALVLRAVVLAGADPQPPAKKLSKEDIEKAEKAVSAYLKEVRGSGAQITHIADESIERVLAGYAFFSVRFRQFPVARVPPPPLKPSNVFFVANGKAHPLTSAKELEKFFKDKLPALTSKARIADGARAWARLSQEFVQDGYYRFSLEKDSIKVTNKQSSGTVATVKVVVTAGGNGSILSTLDFDKAGKFVSATEVIKIRRGPRPICQATKLLDPDPIVRAMAEQALLCMGRPAKSYLDDQRARASPALKKAIDDIWRRILETDP